jgi:broad specificity phosphatase PhoE
MTRFCLIRHGQTDWNVEGRYQGQFDAPLNDIGREQARELGEKLRDLSFAAIYSSDLIRARKTAEIIASFIHLPVSLEPRLREINQGEWEGKHISAIKTRYTRLWKQRMTDPANVRPPKGETIGEVAQRAYAALVEISHTYPSDNILIVSHGLTLAAILCSTRAIPIGEAYEVIPENTEPVWIDWNAIEADTP